VLQLGDTVITTADSPAIMHLIVENIVDKTFFLKHLKLFIVILTTLLVGCADQLTKQSVVEAQQLEANESQAQSMPLAPAPMTYQTTTFVSPEQEYWYKTLVAELSGLRGEYELSAQYLLDVAINTGDAALAERATQMALHAQNYTVATAAAELWVDLAPQAQEAQQILAGLLLRDGDSDRALRYLKRVFAQTADDPEQRLEMISNLLEQQRNTAEALNLMVQLTESHPDDPLLLMLYVRLLISADELDTALKVLEQVITLEPGHEQAILLYARILDRQRKTEAAMQWLQQALIEYPDRSSWRLVYARLLATEARYPEAIQAFEQLLEADPNSTNVLYALGILSIQVQAWEAAQQYFQALLKQDEHADTARYYLGQIAEHNEFSDEALTWYRGIESGENYLSAQARIASVLAKQDKLQDALQHLRTVPVDSHSDALSLVQFEAQLLMERKQYEAAMKVYNRALDAVPDDVDLLYSRGLLAEKLDLIEQTEADFRRVLALDPENVHALNALGYTLADRTDRYNEAYDLIKRALEMRPNDYYILDSMGWVLYRLGRYEEAVEYLLKAKALQEDPEISAHLGEVLWKMGRREEAMQVWREALEKFPQDDLVPTVMQQLVP